MDDKELVMAVRGGDDAAFVQIMDRYKPLVFNICMRMADGSGDAQELAHDAFVEAYLHLVPDATGDLLLMNRLSMGLITKYRLPAGAPKTEATTRLSRVMFRQENAVLLEMRT